jgi:hypothetical protein
MSNLINVIRASYNKEGMNVLLLEEFTHNLGQLLAHGQITPFKGVIEALGSDAKAKGRASKPSKLLSLFGSLELLKFDKRRKALVKCPSLKGVTLESEKGQALLGKFEEGVALIFPLVRGSKSEEEKALLRIKKIEGAIKLLQSEGYTLHLNGLPVEVEA